MGLIDDFYEFGSISDSFKQWLISTWKVIKIWSDLILVVFIAVAYFGYNGYQHQKRMQLIHEPKIHDFYFADYYTIEPSSNMQFRYIPLKIKSIDSESITFKIGNVGHTTKVNVTQHVKFDMAIKRIYFKKEELTVDRKTVSSWAKSGIIYDIARPQNIYINGWIVMRMHELL